MFSPLSVVLVATLAAAATPAQAQHKSPTEAQCRQMVEGMIQTIKSTPLTTERDRRDVRAVLERVEKVVSENRSRGASECESWSAISKIVATQ